MGAAPLAWDAALITQSIAALWSGLAIPSANARLTLATDGTLAPDLTANPNAKHLGMLEKEAAFLIKPSYNEFYGGEFPSPIKRNLGRTESAISGNLIQTADLKAAELLLPGVGTWATGSGYEQVTIGRRAIVYSSVALIWYLESDPTKRGVMHLYKAISDAGLAMGLGLAAMGSFPVAFKGQDITSRASTDLSGNYWKEIP